MWFPFTFYTSYNKMKINQIKETCLYSTRLKDTLSFYTKHLGLGVINYLPDKHLFLRAGTSVLLFFHPEDSGKKEGLPPHFGHGNMHIAFEVPHEDYEEAKQSLIRDGIKIVHEEKWPNKLQSFYFTDPNGHVLEVVTPGLWDDQK